MTDMCTDGRFEVIEKAKQKLILCTNITEEELKVADKFLLRCWQMGWLKEEVKIKPRWATIKSNDDIDKLWDKFLHTTYEVEFTEWLKEEVE